MVAQSFERRYVMIEQNEEYQAIAGRRLEKVRAALPPELIEETGPTP
jgi:hypothetical protein